MTETAAVEVSDLVITRGRAEVIHGVSFRVPTGQIVGLLGPSGCGKTTVLRAIVGVQRITAGRATVLGRPAGTAALRSEVAYVTQQASVYDDLTVGQNVEYFRRVLGAPRDDVRRVLSAVDLTASATALVSSLSGGQRNRVSLAIALLGRPRLLVLDEPTVGLDPILRRDLWELFASIATTGVSLLVSSHVMDEAARCDRLILMREGAVLADDTLPSLLARTSTDSAEAAFLSLIDARAS